MEHLKRQRRPLRRHVTLLVNNLAAIIEAEQIDKVEMKATLHLLQEANPALQKLDSEIFDALIQAQADDNENEDSSSGDADAETEKDRLQDQEFAAAHLYQMKVRKIQVRVEELLTPMRPSSPSPSESSYVTATGVDKRRHFKLPKIELKTFNGDLKEWLGFWAQFRKIDEDDSLHTSDKFHYLMQAMEIGSEASEIVKSYPSTEENYPKAVKALKERFGRESLLMQVYIRELLKLVINNVTNREKASLNVMYVKLESHLRALESLDLANQDPSTWIFPLVESSLPEELLRAWQRSPLSKIDGKKENPPKTNLSLLMEFIKTEVQSEQQITLAQSGFSETLAKDKTKDRAAGEKRKKYNQNDVPTAASLLNSEKAKFVSKSCLFCGKENHQSQDCFKAAKMTLEDRKQKIKESRCCFTCLKIGHNSKACRAKIKCVICSWKHYPILCQNQEGQKNETNREQDNITTGMQSLTVHPTSSLSNCVSPNSSQTVLMKTLHVYVSGNNGKRKRVRLMFDEGSSRSYIKSNIANELRCTILQQISMKNSLFGGQVSESKLRNCFKVTVEGIAGEIIRDLGLINEDVICSFCPAVPAGPWIRELANNKIFLTDNNESTREIDVLIGSDLWGNLMTGKMLKLSCGLVAVESVFGWTLSGQLPIQKEQSVAAMSINLLSCEKSLPQIWSLETLGIRDTAEQISKDEHDISVKRCFQDQITRQPDGRYEIKLPWISEELKIPTNRYVCEKRLMTCIAKLKRQGQFKNYGAVFENWEKEGIIERVIEDNEGHYLPHRPVFKPSSLTTPVRPVYDASCRTGNNPSLNQCLEKGPNMLEQIPAILLRFRERKFGAVSDIRKAFQMVSVCEDDRNFQKFLWWEEDTETFKIYRHTRVVFGLNCSPFILAAVLEHHLNQVPAEQKNIADILSQSLYVDNCVVSFNTGEEYQIFKKMSVGILASAKMELRQWESSLCPNELPVQTSVLGLKWDKAEDSLYIDIPKLDTVSEVTKREVLSKVSQIFDPIGFTCPATLPPKVMLQDSWLEELGWDEVWKPEDADKFTEWYQEIKRIEEIRIPRYAFSDEPVSIQLHTFCDASLKAFAAVVFVRIESPERVKVQLLQAKSRLSPLDKKKAKRVTIPRLELLSCLVGARLANTVKKSLTLDMSVYYWSDSTTALGWIKRDEDWGTFVGNRVREINVLTRKENWKHVPGTMNPADLPSRGCTPSQLLESQWWEGPSWLKNSEDQWPSNEMKGDDEEINKERKKTVMSTMATVEITPPKFSSYFKNVLVFTWARRFINNCKKPKLERIISKFPSIQEVQNGERDLWYGVQVRAFQVNPTLKGIDVIREADGLLHVKTRLLYKMDTEYFKSPILLPKEDPIVHQLIEYVHKGNCHAGTQFTLGKLREKYWIQSGRRTVNLVIRKCITCKRQSTKSISCNPAPLPQSRVETQCAFETTGVDLAGPIILKGGRKAWIVLYTCALYRGVYLDVIDSLTTEDFIESLEQFTWTVGRPSRIFSDNGTNFVGANNLMKKLPWSKLESKLHCKQIRWIFNPPSAPWWGGYWERLVRTVKELLRKMIGTAKLTRKELVNCMGSISYTINNRPLTTISEDDDDLIPLTPAMFMRDLPVAGLPERDHIASKDLQGAYMKLSALKTALKDRFRKEYLSQLVQKGNERKAVVPEIGDIVLVGHDNKKRYDWPLGKILELYPGKDGKIRVAKVKTRMGMLIRPLQRLYPLEVSSPKALVISNEVKSAAHKEFRDRVVTEIENEENVPVKTRSGRESRKPSRYGKWNV